jgi:hypothetical protein
MKSEIVEDASYHAMQVLILRTYVISGLTVKFPGPAPEWE